MQNRFEKLADYLRQEISEGRLRNPLPASRIWCQKLGVGRPCLLQALAVLEHEGLVVKSKRGTKICKEGKTRKSLPSTPMVRLLVPTSSPERASSDFTAIFEKLQLHGIKLNIEYCTKEQTKELASSPKRPNEFFILTRMISSQHALFEATEKPCLVLGPTAEGSQLSYLAPDLPAAVRHATLSLCRKGYQHLVFLDIKSKAPGIILASETFRQTCHEWNQTHSVSSKVNLIWPDFASMKLAVSKLRPLQGSAWGFVIRSPVSLPLVVTSLLRQGVAIPDCAGFVAIEYPEAEVQFGIPLTAHVPSPATYAKEIARFALHYFQTGEILPTRKKILMKELHFD